MPDVEALEEMLSRPTPAVVAAMAGLGGDLMVVGAGGKMGPSLARLATRAMRAAGGAHRVVAVSRFTVAGRRAALEAHGIETVACDLFRPEEVARLPEAPNLVYLVGQKFGTTGDEPRTWATNAYLPGVIAQRFASSRLVAFSTGNVYPLSPADSEGPGEADPTGPIGEYAWSTLARERLFGFFARRHGAPTVLLRLNYAIEPRYGVLRDLADAVRAGRPVDLTMGRVNLIWQRDANAMALRAFAHAAVPPLVINLTGRPAVSVQALAERFGRRWGVEPVFTGVEAATALLSDAARCEALFGPPEVGLDEMVDQVAEWIEQDGPSWGQPTHFEMREGRF